MNNSSIPLDPNQTYAPWVYTHGLQHPYGECQCGCGQNTKTSKRTSPKDGWIKDEPRRFLMGHETRLRPKSDLTGQKFGRWTAISFSHASKSRSMYWNCRCDCGNERPVNISQLRNGTNKSCGCLQKEMAAKRVYKHGLSRHYLRPSYQAMKARCYDPNCPEYPNYGGRGITVCDRWREGFENFLSDMGERPEGHSIDRIDNDGPYSPENCRWAPIQTQLANRRITRFLEFNGEKLTLNDWARRMNTTPNTIRSRLRYGWPIEKVLSEPIKTNHK